MTSRNIERKPLERSYDTPTKMPERDHELFNRAPPFLLQVTLLQERVPDATIFPFSLGSLSRLSVELTAPVTFLVGENGCGKSTLIEAIADASGLPASGGSKADLASRTGPPTSTELGRALRPAFRQRPRDGYFFRAEHMSHFAELLDERREDPDFRGDPYMYFGGRSLHTRSHGEAFLAIFQNRLSEGLLLMDEPESALSPQRQLVLLAHLARMVRTGNTQLIIATHSPILMTFPGAQILSLNDSSITPVTLEETSHYQITKGILEAPTRYWRHLLDE